MKMPSETQLAKYLLRGGLAFVFVYAAISSLQTPAAWVGYVPGLATHFVSADFALKGLSYFQIALGLWLVSGKFVKYAAGVAGLMLIGIVVLDTSSFIITFRDVGLACMAAALVLLERR